MNWPDYVKQQLGGRDPKIGDWFAFCCERDLEQIKTQERLDEVYGSLEDHWDDGNEFGHFFDNEDAALEYLKEPP